MRSLVVRPKENFASATKPIDRTLRCKSRSVRVRLTRDKEQLPTRASALEKTQYYRKSALVCALGFRDYGTLYLGDLLKRSGAVMNHRPKLYSPDGSSGQPNP